jgi:hypothetical protein
MEKLIATVATRCQLIASSLSEHHRGVEAGVKRLKSFLFIVRLIGYNQKQRKRVESSSKLPLGDFFRI